ncbi:efflux RND transporter permease subunit [Kiritimatiellota bacterium B12222]|nr:efflux RND transporter permease subunit [Kiritimatiellota bacterium B12222]
MRLNTYLFCFLLLPLLLLLGAGGFWMYSQRDLIQVDSSAHRLLASDPRNLETFEKINELIPETEMVMVALKIENLFSNQGSKTVAMASNLISQVEGCIEVKSLTHSGRPVRQGFALNIEPFIPEWASPQEWDSIKDFTTRFPLSRNVMVSADGRYAILLGVFERPLPDHQARDTFRQEFMDALLPLESETEAIHVLSFPFIEAEGVNALKADLQHYLIIASVLIFLVLFITFRSWIAVCSVLLLEGTGVLLLLGVFQFLGKPIDIYSGILFPLIGGLQLTFVIHYLSALQSAARRSPPAEAARIAFREVFPPSCIAALTTITGLLTLAFADLPTLTDFGRIGAIAVVVVFLFTFLLPALCAIGPKPIPQKTKRPRSKKWVLPVRAPLGFFLFTLSYALVMIFGIFLIRTDIRAVEFIEPGHPVRESMELLNQDLGGTNIFQVRVDSGKPGGLQTKPVLQYLEDLRAYAYTLEGVTDAYAYSQLYLALNQIWDGDPNPNGSLPQTSAKLALFSQLINASPLMFKDSFVDSQNRSAIMILRSRDMPGKDYLALLETFMDYAEQQRPEGLSLDPVNGLHTILENDQQIVGNQLKTLGITVLLIAATLSLLWLSPRNAGQVLLSNVPALLTIFGIMGLTGFPLNSITIMVAAVILGIAVDDGIHLVSAYRKACKQGKSPQDAASEALRSKLKPMACTSSILIVFLGLLLLTSFPPVAHFGILSALGILSAFLGATLLLPALLGASKNPKKKETLDQDTVSS